MLVDLAYALDEEDCANHLCAELTPLITLHELQVYLGQLQTPPRWFTNLLTATTSAPELSCVHFEFGLLSDMTPEGFKRCAYDDRWILIDRWLACLAEGHGQYSAFTVVVSIPNNREPLGMFLSRCRGAAVEVVIGQHKINNP